MLDYASEWLRLDITLEEREERGRVMLGAVTNQMDMSQCAHERAGEQDRARHVPRHHEHDEQYAGRPRAGTDL